MSTEEISEFEAAKIERHRKKIEEMKRRAHEKVMERKRICTIEEKIPACKLDQLLKDFKHALTERIDTTEMKVNNQRTTGLKEEEKNELKRIVSKTPSKNLNNPCKRQVFARNIIRRIFLATTIRENWEFGDMAGPRDLKILDDRFPSLIGVSWDKYIEWINETRKREGKMPIPIQHSEKR